MKERDYVKVPGVGDVATHLLTLEEIKDSPNGTGISTENWRIDPETGEVLNFITIKNAYEVARIMGLNLMDEDQFVKARKYSKTNSPKLYQSLVSEKTGEVLRKDDWEKTELGKIVLFGGEDIDLPLIHSDGEGLGEAGIRGFIPC